MKEDRVFGVLDKSDVKIMQEEGRALLDIRNEFSLTNQVGTGGKNDLISRQEAVVLMGCLNSKISNAVEVYKKVNSVNEKPIELENIQSTLDYVMWALREMPEASEEDLEYTNLRPLRG